MEWEAFQNDATEIDVMIHSFAIDRDRFISLRFALSLEKEPIIIIKHTGTVTAFATIGTSVDTSTHQRSLRTVLLVLVLCILLVLVLRILYLLLCFSLVHCSTLLALALATHAIQNARSSSRARVPGV